jgi:hypothetical protein
VGTSASCVRSCFEGSRAPVWHPVAAAVLQHSVDHGHDVLHLPAKVGVPLPAQRVELMAGDTAEQEIQQGA